jgi:hypothetical protein
MAAARMAIFKATVKVRQDGRERAVRVTIDAPDAPNPEELDIQHLAQIAWFRPGKTLKIGNVTVSVKAFRKRR